MSIVMPILIILFAIVFFVGGARHGYPVAGREIITRQEQPGRFAAETVIGALGFAAIALFAATDDRLVRGVALLILLASLVLRLGSFLVLAVRRGHIAGIHRAERPAAFRAALAGLGALILLCVIVGPASLLD